MPIHFKNINHVQICVPRDQEEVARQFYIQTLGLQEIPKPEYLRANGGFWLEIADIQLHIGVEDQIHPTKRHPAFEVADLDAVKIYLQNQSVKIKEDPPIYGFKRFSFYDPFGNRIELLGALE